RGLRRQSMRSARFNRRNAVKNDRNAASPTSSAGSNTETRLVNSVARRKKKTSSGFLSMQKTSYSPQPTKVIIAKTTPSANETQMTLPKLSNTPMIHKMTLTISTMRSPDDSLQSTNGNIAAPTNSASI